MRAEAHHLRVETPPGRLEDALLSFVRPLLVGLSRLPEVHAAFFARYQAEVLLFVVGEPAWVHGALPALLGEHLDAGRRAGLAGRDVAPPYVPEVARYGGEEGMRLAERLFQADSLHGLDLLELDARGGLGRSRRELSLVLTERVLDRLGLAGAARIAFYRRAYAWTLEQGRWTHDDLQLLETRYAELRDGLAELAGARGAADPAWTFGGIEAARLAEAWLAAWQPVLEEVRAAHAAGRIAQELHDLAWSYTHMHCNRLGIAADAEAILRYLAQRLHEEGRGGAA